MRMTMERPRIGEGHAVWIISEVGVNHGGSVDTAKRLIDAAVKSGASACKFQAWVTGPGDPYAHLCLTADQLAETQAYAREAGILWFATPHTVDAVDILEALEVPLYKIGSAGLANPELLRRVGVTGKPVIMSVGMAQPAEIEAAFKPVLQQVVALLHCVNSYPTPPDELNLRRIQNLKDWYIFDIGYSSHYPGVVDAIAAVAMGACVIEKHITLSRNQEGPDHKASLRPFEFSKMVRAIRALESMMGHGRIEPQPCEMELRAKVWGS